MSWWLKRSSWTNQKAAGFLEGEGIEEKNGHCFMLDQRHFGQDKGKGAEEVSLVVQAGVTSCNGALKVAFFLAGGLQAPTLPKEPTQGCLCSAEVKSSPP